jgi:hypothetical protein
LVTASSDSLCEGFVNIRGVGTHVYDENVHREVFYRPCFATMEHGSRWSTESFGGLQMFCADNVVILIGGKFFNHYLRLDAGCFKLRTELVWWSRAECDCG